MFIKGTCTEDLRFKLIKINSLVPQGLESRKGTWYVKIHQLGEELR